MNKKILLFECNIFQKNQIIALCNRCNIEVVSFDKREEYNASLGILAGLSGIHAGNTTAGNTAGKGKTVQQLAGPMLVFCGIQQQDVFDLIDAWNKAGIPAIDHKAMLTPFNAAWMPDQLYRELDQEHKRMH